MYLDPRLGGAASWPEVVLPTFLVFLLTLPRGPSGGAVPGPRLGGSSKLARGSTPYIPRLFIQGSTPYIPRLLGLYRVPGQ